MILDFHSSGLGSIAAVKLGLESVRFTFDQNKHENTAYHILQRAYILTTLDTHRPTIYEEPNVRAS